MKSPKSLRAAVESVQAGTKAARVRGVLPEIEQRLSAGARIADVVQALNASGLEMSVATLKSYLYRFRKTQREAALNDAPPVGAHARADTPLDVIAGDVDAPRAPLNTDDAASTTTMLLRHINTARCLRLLRRGATLSRADLARELGLTRATIGYAVKELIDAGFVEEAVDRLESSRRGRPGSGIRLNPGGAYAIGIDLSSIALTGVIVDLGMRVVYRLSEPMNARVDDVERAIEQIARLPMRLVAAAGVDASRIQGVCVSVPGLVDHGGRVVVAPFLRWRDIALRQRLAAHTEMRWPVTVCNDAVAFAHAERTVANERDAQNMLLILLTEGLGGAIVQRGQILEGAHGYAGELGHMVMGTSPAAIETGTFERLAGYERFRPFLPNDRPLDEGLRWLASQRDADASPQLERAFEAWADALTTGMLNLVYLLDPEKIVLGGPLSALFRRIEPRVKQLLATHLLHGFEPPPIFVTRFGADGAAIGAASVVRDQLFALPRFGLD